MGKVEITYSLYSIKTITLRVPVNHKKHVYVCVLYMCFAVFLLTSLYHRQSSDIESNEVSEPVSKKPYTEGHDSKKSSKTLQAESEA